MKFSNGELAAKGFSTKCLWGGENTEMPYGACEAPVMVSVAYAYEDIDHWHEAALGNEPGYIYTRNSNPTVTIFENKVKMLEGTEAALAFGSGMAAIASSLWCFLQPGDRIVSIKDTYGGASVLFMDYLPKYGIDVTLCDTDDYETIEAEILKGCKAVYLESPTNPTMKVTDIERFSKAAHSVGAIVIVDNTFSTPIFQNPLALGADLVLHSATKFMGGHADCIGGVICGSQELINQLIAYREVHGATMDAMTAYYFIRGMKTLKLRVEAQANNAMQVAKYLYDHPMVDKVFYPGLETHPHHDIAKKQMRGFGAVLGFTLKGGADYLEAPRIFMPELKIAHRAANLGPVESVIGLARTTSHVECTFDQRQELGIPENLIRLSCGIEDTEDLIADLDHAFDVLKKNLK